MNWKWIVVLGLGAAGALCAESDAARRLQAATTAFTEVMGTPDKTIPQDLLGKSQCVVVIPGLKKGAFIIGAKYGKGFVSCRKTSGVGWSAPGSVRVEGGSFGFQIGGAATDVFMLIMNRRGMDRLLSTKFTLGGDASVAAGPVGRSSQAETDAAMTAEILTWSRSKGLFAGISLSGATLREDSDWNEELYGRAITNRQAITTNTAVPRAAAGFVSALDKYSGRK
ncbi:MAG: lipid-binding SYLF domain-containing protein [Bryobacteraceae bacterium]